MIIIIIIIYRGGTKEYKEEFQNDRKTGTCWATPMKKGQECMRMPRRTIFLVGNGEGWGLSMDKTDDGEWKHNKDKA